MYEYRDYLKPDYSRSTWSLNKFLLWTCIGVFAAEVLVMVLFPRTLMPVLETLGLLPRNLVERYWLWQLVTSLFLHDPMSPFHLLFNLLVLWFFGPELETFLGRPKYTILLFGAGILGGLAQAMIQYFTYPDEPVIGISSAVMGVIACAALLWPDREVLFFFIFPMRLKYVVLIIVAIDVYYCLLGPGYGGVARLAHLGGAFFGFTFLRLDKRIDHWLAAWVERGERGAIRRQEKMRKRVDELLAKISREGMPSLSRREREFLKKASREFRSSDRP